VKGLQENKAIRTGPTGAFNVIGFQWEIGKSEPKPLKPPDSDEDVVACAECFSRLAAQYQLAGTRVLVGLGCVHTAAAVDAVTTLSAKCIWHSTAQERRVNPDDDASRSHCVLHDSCSSRRDYVDSVERNQSFSNGSFSGLYYAVYRRTPTI
jgi:hypothetical protein